MKKDFRNITNGIRIPSYDYADQPEIVSAPDGSLVCAVTTARGTEGATGTFVGVSRSTDGGVTWSPLERLDESPYETSYSTLIVTDYGRIYCFYDFNIDGLGRGDVFTEPDGTPANMFRYDMGPGVFCFRYSDDSGKTWSQKRRHVPVRVFDIDLENPLTARGKHQYLFWNVSKPFFYGGKFYHAMIKFQYKNNDYMYRSEGVLLVSDNLAYERDVEKLRWETLPDGTKGIAAPEIEGAGLVAEEQCFVPLSDGTIFCVFRTVSGYSACTYSTDGGHTFEPSDYMRYPDGRPVKHVRAATFVWKYGNDRYLYWFHNNSGKSWDGRNPVWVLGGQEIQTEKGRRIAWGRPKILLYDPDKTKGISYPDFFCRDGRYYISETQKSITRMHEIPTEFLESLFDKRPDGVEFALEPGKDVRVPAEFAMLDITTVTAEVDLTAPVPGTVLAAAVSEQDGRPFFRLDVDEAGKVRATVDDGKAAHVLVLQREGVLGARRKLSVTIDRLAGVLYAVCDGVFLDGGSEQRYGWLAF